MGSPWEDQVLVRITQKTAPVGFALYARQWRAISSQEIKGKNSVLHPETLPQPLLWGSALEAPWKGCQGPAEGPRSTC